MIKKLFKKKIEETPIQLQCNVVLLGESGTKKTEIVNSFVFGSSSFSNKEIWVDYKSKIISFNEEKKSIRFDLWDTAGMEKYRTLPRAFYENTDVFILVYDITDYNSFDKLKNYWIYEIKRNAYKGFSKKKNKIYYLLNLVLAIVGNNSHLYENEKVSQEEAKKFADENNAIFREVSSEENYGINELFNSIANKFLEQDLIMASMLMTKNKENKENIEIELNKKLIKYLDY